MYNGWKNRQTWNVALWLGNDYGLYVASRDVGRCGTVAQAMDAIKALCAEVWPSGQTPDGSTLRGVDWRAVVHSVREG